MKKIILGLTAAVFLSACGHGVVYIVTGTTGYLAVRLAATIVAAAVTYPFRDKSEAAPKKKPVPPVDASTYVSSKTGFNKVNQSYPPMPLSGGNISVAIGRRIMAPGTNWRAELEFSRYEFRGRSENYCGIFCTAIKFDPRAYMYMANFYFDFLEQYRLKPYIGFGFGIVHINYRETVGEYLPPRTKEFRSQDDGVAVGFYTGFSFKIIEGLYGDAGAKFVTMQLGDQLYDDSLPRTDTNIFGAQLGLRYVF
jgi:opacity protein-like surface antigen